MNAMSCACFGSKMTGRGVHRCVWAKQHEVSGEISLAWELREMCVGMSMFHVFFFVKSGSN